MSNKIEGAEIFAAGVWNRNTFTDADLDDIVSSFDLLKLSGKVPLKLGHDDAQPLTDGQPALGWVSRLYRRGSKLLADFADVPTVVYEAIRKKLYRSVSIELAKDVTADTQVIPYVLTGVALLGAALPAVGTLRDLAPLAHARMPALQFSRRIEVAAEDDASELRGELRTTQRQMVAMTLEHAVASGRILPRDRELFHKHVPHGTLDDAREWISTTPKPPGSMRAATRARDVDYVAAFDAPDRALVAKARASFTRHALEHFQLTGERLTPEQARYETLMATALDPNNRELLREWLAQPGEV